MSLIASISGIRGTIGGVQGKNLSPIDLLRFTMAYVKLLKSQNPRPKVVMGRDGRISGDMVSSLVCGYLQSMGVDIIQTGLSTTPTVEMAVLLHNADGGIILSASHNSKEWNAMKLLNARGEFISSEDGQKILEWSNDVSGQFAGIDEIGRIELDSNTIHHHVQEILKLALIPVDLIKSKNYRVVADCINSTAAIALPVLFDALNVRYELLNKEVTGDFAHNPEPLPEHLGHLLDATKGGFNVGIAVDPDVDRLALVDEKGIYFGEEYTLVAVADYILTHNPGNTVSNLSSSRALQDITLAHNAKYFASPVGEVHVVRKMKEVHAVIGGEGNGGIIYPELHYGRDALVGIALILSLMATKDKTLHHIKASYPSYYMYKDKIELDPDMDFKKLTDHLSKLYSDAKMNVIDGLKLDFPESWIHLRKSNTEPIVRIYSEAREQNVARALCEQIKTRIQQF